MPKWYIEVNALMNYASNQNDRTITLNDIARFPKADVQKVNHAHWSCVSEDECNYMCDGKDGCGRVLSLVLGSPEDYDIGYCPFCGAKMDEKENEQ